MDADVLIIGSGGGTLARALAPSELSVPVPEGGGDVPREWGNWDAHEDRPDASNRVTRDRDGSIRVHWAPNNRESHRRVCCTWRRILHKPGYPLVFFQAMDISATAHQVGSCRFGADPMHSVLDPDCKRHDLDNLYVVDARFMPSISTMNPTLTIIADAQRVGEHLTARFAQGGMP